MYDINSGEEVAGRGEHDDSSLSHHRDSYYYYANCALGGSMASSVRWFTVPLDVLKGYQQIGYYGSSTSTATQAANNNRSSTSIRQGLARLWRSEGFRGYTKGLGPTAAAYGLQTGIKYPLYEYFVKTSNSNAFAADDEDKTKTGRRGGGGLRCLVAAACAEFVADVFMCPMEQRRVRVQTSTASMTSEASKSSYSKAGFWRSNFASLPTLWARQIPATAANFYAFETVANCLYRDVLPTVVGSGSNNSSNTNNKDQYSTATQLAVTLVAGYAAGFACAVVSHPADSLLSLSQQPRNQGKSLFRIASEVDGGWKQLATRGLGPRILTTGTVIAGQWYLYDSFKTMMGMGTSGGGGRR